MRRYLLRERLLARPERWAATRHRTEQYRASARVAMNRSPQVAHEMRRTSWPQVGHRWRVFRPAIGEEGNESPVAFLARPCNMYSDTGRSVRA